MNEPPISVKHASGLRGFMRFTHMIFIHIIRSFLKDAGRATAPIIFLFAVAFIVSAAFTEPSVGPTGGTVYAPVNTSGTLQTKTGSFTSSNTVTGNIVNALTSIVTVSGRVGIGTSAPVEALDVRNGMVQIMSSSGAGAYSYLRFYNQGYRVYTIEKYDGDLRWYSDFGGRLDFLTLEDGGNVGIGTTNPSAKLEVAGQIKITGGVPGVGKVLTSDVSGLASWTTPSGGSGITSINSQTGPAITLSAGSGISITTPSANNIQIASTGGSGLPAGSSGQTIRHDGTNWVANSNLYNNGTNVGVGTAAPAEKFSVTGNAYVSNFIKTGNIANVNSGLSLWQAAPQTGFSVGFDNGRVVTVGANTSNDAGVGVSLGSTPQGAFYVSDALFETTMKSWGGRSLSFLTAAGGAGDGGSLRMFIRNSDGNVGIGANSPTSKLDVRGSFAWGDGAGSALFHRYEFPYYITRHNGGASWFTAFDTSTGNVGLANGAVWFTPGGGKSFRIDHPLDPENKYLFHNVLEGPEIAVFYRGEARLENGRVVVFLPAYFEALTRKEGRTILLTNIDGGDVVWVETQDGAQVKNGTFVVRSSNPDSSQKFNWEVKAVRGDIDPIQVEVDK